MHIKPIPICIYLFIDNISHNNLWSLKNVIVKGYGCIILSGRENYFQVELP